MNIEELFAKRVSEAEVGKRIWEEVVEKYQVDEKSNVLLLPENTPEYHEAAVKAFPEYLKKNGVENALILCTAERQNAVLDWLGKEAIPVIVYPAEEIDRLIRFYSMYEFTDCLIIGSLSVPDGRLGSNMIGKKGLSLESAVRVMLFDLYDE